MSVPTYSQCRETGVDWLGSIPDHWRVVPCRFFMEERTAKNETGEIQEYLSLMANVGVIPYEEKGDIGNKKPDELSKCKIVMEGDFLINSMNYGIGSYGLSAYSGVCSSVYIVMRPKKDVVIGEFAFRLFQNRSFQLYAQSFGNGILAHRAAIGWDTLKALPMPLPPLSEQFAIAAFLDRETNKIDALIEEQKRMIELLKEKRQAVVSRAVTKGLNPNVPMKNSSVEWLGEVPEHWAVSVIKRVLRSADYGISDALEPSGSIAVLRMGNIQDGEVVLVDLKFVDEVDPALLLERDDLLYNRTNSLDLIGKVGRYVPASDEPVTFASYLVRLRANESCIPAFLAYALNTNGILGAARSRAFVAIGQCNLNPTRYGELELVVPPKSEQEAIVGYLDAEIGRIKRLQDNVEAAIILLQEHRAALISAAVTGKIDVRGLIEGGTPLSEVAAA
jgi:type I restriction enzyme, S subunit